MTVLRRSEQKKWGVTMRTFLTAAAGLVLCTPAIAQDDGRWAIVVHGGAGVIERDSMTPEREAEYRAAMNAALDRGGEILADGGAAIDAVDMTLLSGHAHMVWMEYMRRLLNDVGHQLKFGRSGQTDIHAVARHK